MNSTRLSYNWADGPILHWAELQKVRTPRQPTKQLELLAGVEDFLTNVFNINR